MAAGPHTRSFRRSFRTSEDGVILPLVLVFLALGLLLLTPALGHGFTSLQADQQTNNRAEELHAADSGVEEGIYWLINSRPGDNYEWNETEAAFFRVPYTLNGVEVHVTIEPLTGEDHLNRYKITSRAQRPGDISSTVLSEVYAVAVLRGVRVIDDDWVGDVVVDGSLSVEEGNTTISGDVIVFGEPGTLDMGMGSTILGDVYSESDVTLGQSAEIHCEVLCTGGDLQLGQQSEVEPPGDTVLESEIHFVGGGPYDLTLGNKSRLYGDIYSDNDLTISLSNPNVQIHGNIVVGDANVADNHYNLTVVNDDSNDQGEIWGNLYATGDITVTLASKHSGVYDPDDDPNTTTVATVYYLDSQTYDSSLCDPEAGIPVDNPCTEFPCESCSCPEWPLPEKTCPAVPDPNARVISWELA